MSDEGSKAGTDGAELAVVGIEKTVDLFSGIAKNLEDLAASIRLHSEQFQQEEVENRRARDLFVGMVAHELRTPVVALRSRLELLGHEVTTDAGNKMVEQLLESCDDLVQISSDLLDFQKIEAGALAVHQAPFIPRMMLNRITQDQTAISESFKTRFDLHVEGQASQWRLGDRHRLLQILANILGNAQKFAQGGNVRLLADFRSPEQIVFTVQDSGPGMTPEEVSVMFHPYRQLPTGQSSSGTGLGLVVVQHLVDLMDGEIKVDSVKGEGTSFHVTLPIACCASPDTVEEQKPKESQSLTLDLTGKVLLHVDDDNLQGDLLVEILRKTGVRILRAHMVEEAMSIIAQRRCDFVISDLYLPDGTGLEVIDFFRRQQQKGNQSACPIMLVSASIPEQIRDTLVELQVDRVVIKPLRRKVLIDFLRNSEAQPTMAG